MDFKVAGTEKGITSIQVDTKLDGLSAIMLLEMQLKMQEKRELYILEKIHECIPEPRKEISKYALRLYIINIDPDKIRDVIGPGGKIINKIIAETGVKIDIKEDGKVFVYVS